MTINKLPSPGLAGLMQARPTLGVYLGLGLALASCGSTTFSGNSGSPGSSTQADASANAADANATAKTGSNSSSTAGNGGGSTGGPAATTVTTTTSKTTGSSTNSGSGSSLTPGIIGTGGGSGTSTLTTTSASTPTNFKSCSAPYVVPATANPYFAGVASGTSLTYDLSQGGGPNPTDTAPAENPVFVAPIGSCITAGNVLYFSVAGMITYTASVTPTNGNGNVSNIVSHQKGGILGKSNITAPINSLLGVFLAAGDPTADVIPAALDFSNQTARDYISLSPQVGQVFFIGTGQTSSGAYHEIVVPQGATRLYFAIMDEYQWNNNIGSLTGSIMMVNQ